MNKLKKGDQEYISNGHYRVEGEDFMSIWTFKNKKGITPNDTASNGSAGLHMKAAYESIPTVPDFGNFDTIYVFNVRDLSTYFN